MKSRIFSLFILVVGSFSAWARSDDALHFHVRAIVYPNHFTRLTSKPTEAEINAYASQASITLQNALRILRISSGEMLQGTFEVSQSRQQISRQMYTLSDLSFGTGDKTTTYWMKPSAAAVLVREDVGSKGPVVLFPMWGRSDYPTANFYQGNGIIDLAGAGVSWTGALVHELLHLLDDRMSQYGEPELIDVDLMQKCMLNGKISGDYTDTDLVMRILSYGERCDGKLLNYCRLGRSPLFSLEGQDCSNGFLLNPEAGATYSVTRPTIRSSYMDRGWLYGEFSHVAGAGNYTMWTVIKRPDDTLGAFVRQEGPGGDHRGNFRFTYFHHDAICSEARKQGLSGRLPIYFEVWPNENQSLGETGPEREITCS